MTATNAPYLALRLSVPLDQVEALEYGLMALGAEGVESQDPESFALAAKAPENFAYASEDYLQSLPQERAQVRAYFARTDQAQVLVYDPEAFVGGLYADGPKQETSQRAFLEQVQALLDRLAEHLPGQSVLVDSQLIHAEDWAEAWKAHYVAKRLTPRLGICPSWLAADPLPWGTEVQTLFLDPGAAFGTGEHESTALSLGLLDLWAASAAKASTKVLDLGCGSGILAIAAAKLGLEEVLAIDIDPRAVAVARENVAQNKVDVQLQEAELDDLAGERFDLILANLTAELHEGLASAYAKALLPGGSLVISGIISGKETALLTRLQSLGFRSCEARQRGDWWAYLMEFTGEA